jgi:hypothetical protein
MADFVLMVNPFKKTTLLCNDTLCGSVKQWRLVLKVKGFLAILSARIHKVFGYHLLTDVLCG